MTRQSQERAPQVAQAPWATEAKGEAQEAEAQAAGVAHGLAETAEAVAGSEP